ncbi:MAG TPA: transglycosylase SLT domain-containing protein, partial [Spirochaetota bacterium]|nr:transglycosylase SLT domain-containing protein [Spirochaetota bacterium]
NELCEFIKKLCNKNNEKKIFFESLEKLYKTKEKWALYNYAMEAFNYRNKQNTLKFLKDNLKYFTDKDSFNYNFRAKILYNEYDFNNQWIENVIDFVNDYPKFYHSKTILNLMLRSSIYQNKKEFIMPYLDKINIENMDTIEQSNNYYIFYLIDKNDKWKNILLEKYPFSYGAITFDQNSLKTNQPEYQKKADKYTDNGKMTFKKINYLLEFDLSNDVKQISDISLNNDEKIEFKDILYNYFIYKEDFYNAVKVAGEYAVLIYGENLIGVDKETLKRLFPSHYYQEVLKYSKEFDIEPSLIYAVMREESRYKKDIKSAANAIGL